MNEKEASGFNNPDASFLNLSTIICSQRDPSSWSAMIMNDEVSANAILKRATRHYTVMIKPKATG